MTTLHASALSAPPPPPIPALREPLAPDDLAAALRAFSGSYYANHPFHTLMHEGRLTRRQLQGWVANRLAYQRAIPRKDAALLSNCPDPDVRREWLQRIVDHDGTEPGTRRHRDVDQARRGARRAARGDGGRAARAAGRAVRHRSLRHVLQDEAVDRRRRLVADGALRAGPDAPAHRRVPAALPVGPCRSARLLQEPPDAGAARQPAGLAARPDALHDGRDAAPRVRRARVQARAALGDDRHDPSRLRGTGGQDG